MAATLAHRAEYGALRATIAALGTLPPRLAARLGETIGTFGYRPLRIRRGTVERQIAAAFPERTPAQVHEIARAAYRSLGRTAIETALLPALGRDGVLELLPEAVGLDHVEAALARGRGALLVTGHLGNWELGGAWFAARGFGIDVVVRRQGNPLFDRYLYETRKRAGMEVVYDADAVRRIPRSLRENRLIALVADQGVRGLASTFVPFFGRPAKTPRGPAVFALKFGTPLIHAAVVRRPDRRYRIVLEPIPVHDTGDRERDIDAVVAAYAATLEKWVRLFPEQYFWHHRRWRRQPPDTPPHLREP